MLANGESLVTRVLIVTLYRTSVLTETVRKRTTGFAHLQIVTELASVDIDYAVRSAIVPSL